MKIISVRHEALLKIAAQRSDFVQAIISKYGDEIKSDSAALSLINKYYQYKKIKEIRKDSPEYSELISSMPESWSEARTKIEAELNIISADPLKEDLISMGLNEFDISNKDVRIWLEDRYIKNNKTEIHPIEEAVSTVREYSESKDAILTKIKSDDGLREELIRRGFSEERLRNMLSLSVDDMIAILGQYDGGGQTTIRTVGVEIRPEEMIDKFGPWTLWLPRSQETSAKIAGYDDVTKEPITSWCTARTKGSNLFYHYISRGDIISFLFYIIKDNPSEANDWISLGFIGKESEGLDSVKPVFDGKDGGLTVNRANKGLTEEAFREILKNNTTRILERAKKVIKRFRGKNPATEEIRPYAEDVSLFRKAIWSKSKEERADFSAIILKLDPSEQVKDEASKVLAKEDPKRYVDSYIRRGEGNNIPNIDIAAKNLAISYPEEYIFQYSKQPWSHPYLDIAYKNWAEKTPRAFLTYRPSSGEKYLDIALKKCLEKEPGYIVKQFELGQEWTRPYIGEALESAAEKDPEAILERYRQSWAKPYFAKAGKRLLEINPEYIFESAHSDWTRTYQEGLDATLIELATSKLAEENPAFILEQCTWHSNYFIEKKLGLAVKNVLDKKLYLTPKPETIVFNDSDWLTRSRRALDGKSFKSFLDQYEQTTDQLSKLSKALKLIGLNKEAAEVINLKPVEHPDWKDEWEEPKENDPSDMVPEAILSSGEGSPESKINDVLKGLGVTLLTDEYYDPLGRGHHGIVYRCIYNGRPAVAKIQYYPEEDKADRYYGQDVDSWEKLMSLWESVPDFVRKHIPQVFLAEKGIFNVDAQNKYKYNLQNKWGIGNPFDPSDTAMYPFEYQVMVMEELKPLPRRLGYSIEGSSPNTAWLWEEETDNLYRDILAAFEKYGATPPTIGEIKRKIAEAPNNKYISTKDQLYQMIREKIHSQFLITDINGRRLSTEIGDILFDLAESFTKSIPRWTDDYPGKNYIPRDVRDLWEAVRWLRSNGMRGDDITSENIMIDNNGVLKIADLGSL